MARLTQPRRSEFTGEDGEAYDAVIGRRGGEQDPELGAPSAGDYFGALLNSPGLCAVAARMGAYVRTVGERGDSYSHADRELVDQVLAADWRTNVVQRIHVPDAVGAGVRIEAIEALRDGDEDVLTGEERQLVDYIRGVVSGTTTDQDFAAMRERMGTRGAVDYTGFILWLQWTMRMFQALGMEDPPDEEIGDLIAAIKDGSYDVSSWRTRIR